MGPGGYPIIGIENLSLFVVSGILLNLTPGQDTLYIVGRSVGQGRSAGLVSVLGIMTGALVHTLLAALGLSVVLATSSAAFGIVKYIGAAYLVWIGIGFVRIGGHRPLAGAGECVRLDLWKTYRQGLLTNLLNPKVALFFLSFLPQFVDPQTEFAFVSFLLLGQIFFTTGSLWCTILVFWVFLDDRKTPRRQQDGSCPEKAHRRPVHRIGPQAGAGARKIARKRRVGWFNCGI